MGVAHFEESACFGSGLLNGGLDELVDELRDEQAKGKEDALQLSPKDEMGDEAAEANEDRDEGDPREEMAQLVTPLVPDVSQGHRFQGMRRHVRSSRRQRAEGGTRGGTQPISDRVDVELMS